MTARATAKLKDALSRPGACLIIGEVAQAHDGSLGLAHAFIDAIADSGADAVKFQTHIADAESTPSEPWRVQFSRQDADRYSYWRRMEFTEDQWAGLAEHAAERELVFMSSPFSTEAVDLLMRTGVVAFKVASGELTDRPVLEAAGGTGLPVLLSTGMSTLEEIDQAVGLVRSAGSDVAVLQTTSAYPTAPDQVGLNMLESYRQRYGCPVGLSDHSGTIWPSIAATVLGAAMVEVHVTLSRQMFGPDVTSSVTTAELAQLVEGVRFVQSAMASPVDKDRSADELEGMRRSFQKSLVTTVGLAAGTVLRAEHLAVKKPGTGIPGSRMSDVLGRALARDVETDHVLQEEDLA